MKCSLCNREHADEVDQFAEHISAHGGVEAWQMWKEFSTKLLKRALIAEQRQEPTAEGADWVRVLSELEAKATPSPWRVYNLHRVSAGGITSPLMSYLYGPLDDDTRCVSLGSENKADHELVVALRNAWPQIKAVLSSAPRPDAGERRFNHAEPGERHLMECGDIVPALENLLVVQAAYARRDDTSRAQRDVARKAFDAELRSYINWAVKRSMPKEPTPAMLAAAVGWREADPSGELTGELDMFNRIYRAMYRALEAARALGREEGK